jgi:hypothetical protein
MSISRDISGTSEKFACGNTSLTKHVRTQPNTALAQDRSLCDHLRLQTFSRTSSRRLPWPHILLQTSFLPGSVSVALASRRTSTLSGSALTCVRLRCRSCALALLWCSVVYVSSLASFLAATLWAGTPFSSMVCVRSQTVRSPSQRPHLARLGAKR